MSNYNPRTHRPLIKTVDDNTVNGIERYWGPDLLAHLLADAQFYNIHIADSAPASTLLLWFDPGNASANAPGQMKYYNGAAWVSLTEAGFMDWLKGRLGITAAANDSNRLSII